MPIVSDRMKKEAHKAEKEALERREREQHEQREEKTRKEREEHEQKEREEKEKRERIMAKIAKKKEKIKSAHREKQLTERRAEMRKSLAIVKKESAKVISDESLIDNHGYKFVREELTRGRFSIIYKAQFSGNEKLVLKMVILDKKLPKRYHDNIIEQSLKIVKYVGSGGESDGPKVPQFVKVYELFQTPQKVYIFMDECQTLSVKKRIKAGDTITEYETRKWAKQVADGIDFLHKSGIAHRNVRSENVIFDMESNTKLVGLDYACIYWDSDTEAVIPQERESSSEKAKGMHFPPEVFTGTYDASAVDVWSLGVLICYMLVKELPFSHESSEPFDKQWENFKIAHSLGEAETALLDQLFHIDESNRIKIEESLKIRWLRKA